jgi:hypothetical protein
MIPARKGCGDRTTLKCDAGSELAKISKHLGNHLPRALEGFWSPSPPKSHPLGYMSF